MCPGRRPNLCRKRYELIISCLRRDGAARALSMKFQTLELAYDSGIAGITLNRPEKRNALSFQLIEEVLAALDEIEKSDALVTILTGAGQAFCAGMDMEELKSRIERSHAENVADSRRLPRIFRRLYDFPKPTIAAVNCPAIA